MMQNNEIYDAVIGLEVHAQLSTRTKIFCGCSTQFGTDANAQICPVCCGLPGALPVLNRKAVESIVKIGIATHCTINPVSLFSRKNYFYPDLPKGYQISQYEKPICENGIIEIDLGEKTKEIRILRIHLEEDAGKSIHDEDYVESDATLIDLNRCGTPLIEIVSKPDFRSANEATDYLTKLRQLVRYLNICDGNMEQGSLRCDANVSVRQKKDSKLGEKTELKNMNSIRNVEKAIDFEIGRQIKVIESGAKVKQQTLLWDADKKKTKLMRSKEEAHDYRYFPEPDLAPVEIKQNWIKKIKSEMPELPNKKFSRFIADYKLSQYETKILTADIDFAEYFEKTLKIVSDPKLVAKWMLGEVLRILNDKKLKISDFTILPEKLANLLKMIKNNVIGESAAKKVFEQMLDSSDDVAVIIKKMNLVQVSDKEFIERLIDNVLTKYSKEVELYKSGKTKLFGFFMGQLMKESGGKANPKVVSDQLRKKLAH